MYGRADAGSVDEKNFAEPIDELTADPNNSASRRGGNALAGRRKGCVERGREGKVSARP